MQIHGIIAKHHVLLLNQSVHHMVHLHAKPSELPEKELDHNKMYWYRFYKSKSTGKNGVMQIVMSDFSLDNLCSFSQYSVCTLHTCVMRSIIKSNSWCHYANQWQIHVTRHYALSRTHEICGSDCSYQTILHVTRAIFITLTANTTTHHVNN